jgi:hypothetical protein
LFDHRTPSSNGRDSIFDSGSAGWGHILDGVEKPVRSTKNNNIRIGYPRQTITARETKVLTGMLDMIFESTNKDAKLGHEPVVVKQGRVDDFFGRLRRHSKHGRWMDDLDASLLDQKKEQIGYCNSDQELLDWAIREVFEESKAYEAAARRALAEATRSPGSTEAPPLQPATYPHMIPILMRTFRDKYHDPHLALSIFNYTQSLSIVSYVYGCTTEAYNELVQTKWEFFRDLPGVYQSINEMIVNGVRVNTRTRKWIETIRRDVLSQRGRLDTNEASENEAWQLLTKIDQIIAENDAILGSKSRWEKWKAEIITEDQDDSSFDNWGEMIKNKQIFRRGTTKADDAKLPTYKY